MRDLPVPVEVVVMDWMRARVAGHSVTTVVLGIELPYLITVTVL